MAVVTEPKEDQSTVAQGLVGTKGCSLIVVKEMNEKFWLYNTHTHTHNTLGGILPGSDSLYIILTFSPINSSTKYLFNTNYVLRRGAKIETQILGHQSIHQQDTINLYVCRDGVVGGLLWIQTIRNGFLKKIESNPLLQAE